MSAGKGDRPRNCYSNQFRNNYDEIFRKPKKNRNVEAHNVETSQQETSKREQTLQRIKDRVSSATHQL